MRDAGSTPGSGGYPEREYGSPLQCSCLENPMDRGVWWAMVHGVTKSWTWLSIKRAHKTQSPRNIPALGFRSHFSVLPLSQPDSFSHRILGLILALLVCGCVDLKFVTWNLLTWNCKFLLAWLSSSLDKHFTKGQAYTSHRILRRGAKKNSYGGKEPSSYPPPHIFVLRIKWDNRF